MFKLKDIRLKPCQDKRVFFGHVLFGTPEIRVSNLKCDPSKAIAEFFEPRAKE